jgi:DNA-binding PadR family transcriptional regulator
MREMAGAHPEMMRKACLFVLWLIKRKEMHGYEIIKLLRREGHPPLGPNRLYPMLNEMMDEGLIRQKELRDGKRVRKAYVITAAGRKLLLLEKKAFGGLVGEFLKEMLT